MVRRLLGAASVAMALSLWEGAARAGWVNSQFLTPPSEIAPTLWKMLASGEIEPHIYATMERILAGFLVATPVAIVAGLLCALWAPAMWFLSPVVESLRAIPTLALLPAFLLLFGIGFRLPFAFVVWVAWVPVFFNTVAGVRAVPAECVEAARVDGANALQVVRHIIYPLSQPSILVGMRLAMGASFWVISAAEMLGSTKGMGFYIYNASQTFHTPQMYATIVALGALAAATNAVLVHVARVVMRHASA